MWRQPKRNRTLPLVPFGYAGCISAFILFLSLPTHAADPLSDVRSAFALGLGKHLHAPLTVDTRDGTTTLRSGDLSRNCTLCNAIELRHEARSFGAQVAGEQTKQSPAVLDLREIPSRSTILIDGIQVPDEVQTTSIEPGKHLLTLYRNNVSATLETTLTTNQAHSPHLRDITFSHMHRPLLFTGIVTLGLGIGVSGSGSALMALNNRCATTETDVNGTCITLHDTHTSGAVLIATGITLIVTGMVCLIVRAVNIKHAKQRFFKNISEQVNEPQ